MIVWIFVAAVLVLMLAFTLLDIWTAAPSTPNYGLHLIEEDRGHLDDAPVEGCDCEDCTEDPMDAYLEERAAGNGVLPAAVDDEAAIVRLVEERRHEATYSKEQVISEVLGAPKIHYKCADFQLDGEPEKVCPDCAPLLEGVKPVVTRG